MTPEQAIRATIEACAEVAEKRSAINYSTCMKTGNQAYRHAREEDDLIKTAIRQISVEDIMEGK